MARVGLRSCPDGRSFVNQDLRGFLHGLEQRIANALRTQGHEVLISPSIIAENQFAVNEAAILAAGRPGHHHLQHPGVGVSALLSP